MAAPKTVLTYPLNGAQRDFAIPFEYLARKFVVVTLIGKTRQTLTLNSDYRFTARTTITTTKAWGPGDLFTSIELRRVTSATERLVDFADGSILRAYDLNTSQVQSLHIAEEARDLTADTIGVNNDGDLDARGRRIVNVGDGVLDGDSVNMGQNRRWAESALNQANRSEQQAIRSEQQAGLANNARINSENAQINSENARDASRGYRNEAQNFRDLSGAYRTEAQQARDRAEQARDRSETAAVNSQSSNVNSTNQADRAKTEADRAKTEADKLGNWNSLGGALDGVSGTSVFWKGRHDFLSAVTVKDRSDANFIFANPGDGSNTLRMTRNTDGLWLLVDDARGRIRMNSGVDGTLSVPGDLQAGANIVARGGAVHINAQSEGQNAHLWFNGADGVERALIWVGNDGYLHLRSKVGRYISLSPAGVLEAPQGIVLNGANIAADGNMGAPWLRGGNLFTALDSVKQGTRIRNVPTVIWERGVDTAGGSGDQGAAGSTIWLREPLLAGDFYMFEIYGGAKFYSTTNCIPYGDSTTEEHNVQFDSGGAMLFVLTDGGRKITVRAGKPNNQYGIRRVFLFKLQLA